MKDEKRTNVVWKFEGKMRVGPQTIGIFGSHEVSGVVWERARRRCGCLGLSRCVCVFLYARVCEKSQGHPTRQTSKGQRSMGFVVLMS